MKLLFVLLAVVAALIFLAVPFRVAVGNLAVLAWTAFLLYLIFYRPDPVSRAVEELAFVTLPERKGGDETN